MTFEDIEISRRMGQQPGRTAFIDECGNFGFDFEKEGTSLFYIVCAVIIKNDRLQEVEAETEKIGIRCGFQNGEIKSSLIGSNHNRRLKVLTELLMPEFSVIVLIADKRKFYEDSPLTTYKDSFVKFLHQRLYETMYVAFPKLKIIEDEYGNSEFQAGYREYIRNNRKDTYLFNDYDFDYVDSKHSSAVQIADVIAGSIAQRLLDNNAPDVLKIFQGKILGVENFPNTYPPYFAGQKADDRFDENIYTLADHCAMNYINSNYDADDEDIRLRVLLLKHLLFVVRNISAVKYVSSAEIIRVLSDYSDSKVRKDYLYRKIIAPLRDSSVIIASSSHGYKIPTCIDDIHSYVNQTNGIVGPMLSRVEKCRGLILKQTDGLLDILDDPALTKYKRYFGDY